MTRTVSVGPATKSRAKQMYKKPNKGSKNLKALIKQTITQLAEKKSVFATGANVDMYTVAGTVPAYITLTPVVSQGVAQNNRVGNAIRVTKATVRGHVILKPYNATTNTKVAPVALKIWLCRYKTSAAADLSLTNVATAFFDSGGGVSGMTGNILDMDLFPNQDSWELIQTKTYKLGLSSTSGSALAANVQFFDNSPSQIAFSFEYGSKLGNCLFNDGTAFCTNKSMFLVFQAVYADGSGSSGANLCELDFCSRIEYIDV